MPSRHRHPRRDAERGRCETFAINERPGQLGPARSTRAARLSARQPIICRRAARSVASRRRSTGWWRPGDSGPGAAAVGQGDAREGLVARDRRPAGSEEMSSSAFFAGPAQTRSRCGVETASSSERWSACPSCRRLRSQPGQDAGGAGRGDCRARIPRPPHKFLTADAQRPVLFNDVQMYDADAERSSPDRYVLTADGKIVSVGTAAPARLPAGTRMIDGAGKTLVPGLWDSHMHVRRRLQTVSELALGVTSCRNPGGPLELEVSQRERRDAGDIARARMLRFRHRRPEGAAGGAGQPGGRQPRRNARRSAQDQGQQPHRVKFYTSMNPGMDRAGRPKLAHQLGLHVHGHIPAGMRTARCDQRRL